MRNTYIVSYDVADAARLRKVFKTMMAFGEHLQLSVFICDLSPSDRVRLEGKLGRVINHREDQILFIDLGPERGRSKRAIGALGLPCRPRTRAVTVI